MSLATGLSQQACSRSCHQAVEFRCYRPVEKTRDFDERNVVHLRPNVELRVHVHVLDGEDLLAVLGSERILVSGRSGISRSM